LNSAGALALVLAGPGRGPGMQKQVLLRTTTSEASSLSLARSWSPAPRGRCGCRGRSEGQLGWGLNGHFCRAEPPVDPPQVRWTARVRDRDLRGGETNAPIAVAQPWTTSIGPPRWVLIGRLNPSLDFGRRPALEDAKAPAQCCTIVCDGYRSGQEARG
jgi:hypothetical protein